MRTWLAVGLQLLVSIRLAAQLAPVPSHEPRPSHQAGAGSVARVNGVPIRAGDLAAAMDAVMPLTSYHQNVKPEKVEELRQQALDGLIDDELRYQEAVRLKIRVAPIEVEQALERARRAYRGREEFERARRASGATMPQLRASILRALKIQKAYEQVVASRCRVREAEAASYYGENTARFVLPEQLRPSLITIGVDPSATPDNWERARQKAQDVARQIGAGASFEALARQHSSDASRLQGGDLGFIHRGQLIEEFERALSGLAPGQVSPVVQTIYGFHLLRLVDSRPAAQKTFAEVKTKLLQDLTETRCSQASAAWVTRLRRAARVEIVDRGAHGGRIAGLPD